MERPSGREPLLCDVALDLPGDVPGHQLVNTVDGMVGNVFEYMTQIRLRVHAIELAEPIRLYIAAARSPPAS